MTWRPKLIQFTQIFGITINFSDLFVSEGVSINFIWLAKIQIIA